MRSAVIGAIIGVVPGVGGAAANYIAYFQAVQTSPDPDAFGTGDVRGVIAPEASNDAKDGTGFLPTLGLGVPGSASMAVLLGAFVLHGITPGPFLFDQNLPIVTTIILALLMSNLLTSLIGLGTANYLVKITRIDVRLIAPVVIALSFFGTYALGSNVYNLFIALFFGLMGYGMVKVNMSRVPMILGVVLGPIVEVNFFRALRISQGDYSIFYQSELSLALILLTIASLFFPFVRSRTSFL
jgi:putative tricarboxylic transport membrane protein